MPLEMVVSHHHVLVENLTQVLWKSSQLNCRAISPALSQVLLTTTTSKKSGSLYLENQGQSFERGGKEVFGDSKIQIGDGY